MKNPKKESLDEIGSRLTDEQHSLLDAICQHFIQANEWISERALHHRFGKPAAVAALKKVGGSIVFEAFEAGKGQYRLTLLGMLLAADGNKSESLLVRYLEYVRERFQADPDVDGVNGKDVKAALNVSSAEMRILGALIEIGHFWGGTSVGLGSSEEWSAGVPDDVDDLPDIEDLSAYVRLRALEQFDPDLPVSQSDRMSYTVARRPKRVFVAAEGRGAMVRPEGSRHAVPLDKDARWDVFICHASEDKPTVVDPLADALKSRGLRVWYDRWALEIGDSLRRKIDEGLAKSRFGIVVLSPAFFKKEWPQKELDGLSQREVDGTKVILPVWHKLNREAVAKHSPTLADRVAGTTDQGVEVLADELVLAMGGRPELSRTSPTKQIPEGPLESGRGPTRSLSAPPTGSAELESEQRTRRGLVLSALSEFADLVREVCGGLTIRGTVKTDFYSRIKPVAKNMRRVCEEQSQWIGPDWVEQVDRLERLAWQIVNRFAASYETHGPVAAKFSDQGAAHCEEFDRLYQQLRRGGVGVTQRLSNEEQEVLCQAAGQKGEIYKLYTDQTDYFVRIGDRDYVTDERPNLRVKFVDALDRLIEKHLARHESDKLYSLTAAGWDAAEEVCKDLPRRT